MLAAIKAHVHWFRYLGVQDLESPPLQPSRVAWARRFCDDLEYAANREAYSGTSSVAGGASAIARGSDRLDASGVPTVAGLPTFTLRYPGRSQTQLLGMTGIIEWREFHAARAYPSSGNIDRLLDTVDRDLAELEFGSSPLQSLSEIVLALEWLFNAAITQEEARIWTNGAQILFQLSVAYDCDTQIDFAWAEKFRAEDANEPWACDQDSFDLPVQPEHIVILKRVATELRSVLQGSYSDARDVAGDVGDALEVIWCRVVAQSTAQHESPPAIRRNDAGIASRGDAGSDASAFPRMLSG